MSGRADILGRLKQTLDLAGTATARFSRAEQRILDAAPSLIPQRGQAQGPAMMAMFIDEAQKAQADVRQLAALSDVPKVVAEILKQSDFAKLKAAPHKTLQALDWSGLDIVFGCGAGEDLVGLSMAYGAVSETGTLVLLSGPETPTTLNFLPDVHIVVLHAHDVVGNYEQVWARLRREAKPDMPVLPRTVNWITGPSRTADIEQTLLLGAHGPRKLIILLIDAQTT
ncbi:MAG: lactate utilization protein [Magnetovibrio sp.]|nr:lactate utilization protein [Magnetovibrio sp.]